MPSSNTSNSIFDQVRSITSANLTNEECNDLLWTCTSFPFQRGELFIQSELKKAWEEGGGTFASVIEYARRDRDK